MFQNRESAAAQLTGVLQSYNSRKDTIVVAAPTGSAIIGNIIAQKLNLPLNTAFIQGLKPAHASDRANEYLPPNSNTVARGELKSIKDLILKQYSRIKEPSNLVGKSVIIADDGFTTEKRLVALLMKLQGERPREIAVAIPATSLSTIFQLGRYVNKVYCLEIHEPFSVTRLYC